jgi:hypothetical protein
MNIQIMQQSTPVNLFQYRQICLTFLSLVLNIDGVPSHPMKSNGISDELWEFIEPLLLPRAKEGKPRAYDRTTVNAILYVLKTGIPWNDLPLRGVISSFPSFLLLKNFLKPIILVRSAVSTTLMAYRPFFWFRQTSLPLWICIAPCHLLSFQPSNSRFSVSLLYLSAFGRYSYS